MQTLLVPKIIFGRGKALLAAEEAAFFGKNVLIAAAPSFMRSDLYDSFMSAFKGLSVETWTFSGRSEL